MKIALFHYHLKPGGVTEVIVFAVRSILTHIEQVEELRLVTGEEEGADNVIARIRIGLNQELADKLKLDVLEEIAYVEDGNSLDPDMLSRRLEARYEAEDIWWIHNYHLGKNPAFTAAIMKIAAKGNKNFLLHIHDFPECGRWENQRQLANTLVEPPYLSGPNVRYAVINERDRRILSDAGLGEATRLLSNPVPPPPQGSVSPDQLKKILENYCESNYPGFIPGAPVLLYPVRAIRRKNILEAALFSRLLNPSANIVVTLPGISASEKPYSDIVETVFRSGLIAGAWNPEASGNPDLSYANLASGCDGIIASSVQEGFGYLYLNALHWRKPLLARYLDTMDSILGLFGEYPRRFWAELRIPLDKDTLAKTKTAYEKKLHSYPIQMDAKIKKSILSALNKLTAGECIDMSYLSVADQLAVLEKAKNDSGWADTARALNSELLDSAARTLKASAPDMSHVLKTRFNEAAYATVFGNIVTGFGQKLSTIAPAKVQAAIDKAFGRIDYMRLLYDSL